MTHREAVLSLAAHLTLAGNRAYPELRKAGWQSNPGGVPDVLSMKRFAYGPTTWRLDAYEIKVTASDLRGDVRAGKWHRYVEELGARFVWFALATADAQMAMSEVPKECGVVFLGANNKWLTKRTPRSLQHSLSKVDPMLLIAMMDAQPYEIGTPWERERRMRQVMRGITKVRDVEDMPYSELSRAAKDLGIRIRGALAQSEPVAERVHAWADRIVTIWAEILDETPENLKASIVKGHEYESERLIKVVQGGLRAEKDRKLVETLIEAARIANNPMRGSWADEPIRRGEALAKEIASLRCDDDVSARRRKRGAA